MIRRPPRSTRTDTLFPYTTLFRSLRQACSSFTIFATEPQQVRSRAGYLGELGVGFRPLPQTPPDRQRPFDILSQSRGSAAASATRSEEHTSELQSLMRISYAVFCLKKKKQTKTKQTSAHNTQ